MTWKIEYDNDTGPGDEGFWEWWTVTDGKRSFKCDSEDDAKWLLEALETHLAAQVWALSKPQGENSPFFRPG